MTLPEDSSLLLKTKKYSYRGIGGDLVVRLGVRLVGALASAPEKIFTIPSNFKI